MNEPFINWDFLCFLLKAGKLESFIYKTAQTNSGYFEADAVKYFTETVAYNLPETQPFSIALIRDKVINASPDDIDYSQLLDLPFECCHFETPGTGILCDHGDGHLYYLRSIFCKYIKNDKGEILGHLFMSMMTVDDDIGRICVFNVHRIDQDNSLSKTPYTFTKIFLDRLNSKGTVKGITTAKIRKIKRKNVNGFKEFLRLRKPIIITSKSQTKTISNLNPKLIIDWTYRWQVRGHWRKLANGIGKGPDGKRCVPGQTWVAAYVKGPDDKPLIQRKRQVVR